MKLKQVSEVVYKFYYDGRPKSTAQTLSPADITQACVLAYAGIMRSKYYDSRNESRKNDERGDADYSFLSPILSVKKFKVGDSNNIGMRRVCMEGIDLFSLPLNAHFTNVYPLGSGCNGEAIPEVTQVKAGEERFYLSPDFSSFLFYVVKGRGIDTYHIPACVTEVEIETTYNTEDVDISMDLAFEVTQVVLGESVKVNGQPMKILDNTYSPQPREIKHRLQEAEINI